MQQHYFDIRDAGELRTLDSLLELNIRQEYYGIGNTIPDKNKLGSIDLLLGGHKTAGIFRGQRIDYPLLPKVYRESRLESLNLPLDDPGLLQSWALLDFHDFASRAKAQNPDFPDDPLNQLCIAQHFGVDTPLLDWSRSVIPAVYFAVSQYYTQAENEGANSKAYLYHIDDDRYLARGIPEDTDLVTYQYCSLIEPYYIDRRIERQKGVFTFHPAPESNTESIPVMKYTLPHRFVMKLKDIFEGMGVTQDYFFPDYAGIADSLTNRYD